jgi:signal peptidase I
MTPAAVHDSPPRTGLAWRLAVNVPIALALVAVALIQLGFVQTLRVSSINMVPTLALDDHVLVQSYGGQPARGDVVVYRSPFDNDHLQLGRIVAIGGDSVELGETGLQLDGQPAAAPLDQTCGDRDGAAASCNAESLLAAETVGNHRFFTRRADGFSGLQFPLTVVPEGHVFVLSDNRVDERDSRIYGAIPDEAVVGVLSFVYYAFDETGIRWDRMSRRVS